MYSPMETDHFITKKPSAELVPYIAYYYYHFSADENFEKSFSYYPHYKNALTAYKNVDYKISEDFSTKISSAANNAIHIIYSKLYNEIGKVSLQGSFQKMGIVFQPLGVQHFLNSNYAKVFPNSVNKTNCFGKEFEKVLNSCFETSTINEKASLLNQFFQAHYLGFSENRVTDAVAKIIESRGVITVSDLSESLHIHRKTLLRLFKKHLDCTIEEYKKLVRFRFALEKIQQEKKMNLTQISAAHYYDQSDFIRQFKELTQLPPKKFMNVVSKMGEEDTYWNFKK